MGPRNVSADCYDHRMKALRGVAVNGPSDIVLRDLWAEQKRAAMEAAEEADEQQERSRQASENGNGVADLWEDPNPNSKSGLRRRGGGAGAGTGTLSSVSSGLGLGSGLVSGSGSASLASNGDDDDDTLVDEDKYKKKPVSKATSIATEHAGKSRVLGETTATETDATTTTTTTTTIATAKKKKERNPDPLLWFGVFVPAPLRNAQSIFQKGLQDVVEMAMIRQRLLELEEAIEALQQAKKKITQPSSSATE
ncbi:hypothetical protein BGZ54_000143 [Gamsiella multidivaricata]|nr:hypothetical protein BGZ54_000143 [Gamsiella multidivaricata]